MTGLPLKAPDVGVVAGDMSFFFASDWSIFGGMLPIGCTASRGAEPKGIPTALSILLQLDAFKNNIALIK